MSARFANLGGQAQMLVDGPDDLALVHELDPARWAATSAPLEDLHLEPRLARLVVPAGDRLRVSHLLAARDWLLARLASTAPIADRRQEVALDELAKDDAGARLRAEAETVLEELEVEDRSRLSLKRLRRFRKAFDTTLANGDGIVTPDEVPDPEAAELATWILATVGGRKDPFGVTGVGHEEIQDFTLGAGRYRTWRERPKADPALEPFGDLTDNAAALVDELGPKVEEWFLQCALLEQEGERLKGVGSTEEELRELLRADRDALRRHLARTPLSDPRTDARLDLRDGINAIFRERMRELTEVVLSPVLGPDPEVLDRAGWDRVRAHLRRYRKWRKEKPAQPFEAVPEALLDPENLAALGERLGEVVEIDLAASDRLARLEDLEKLLLLCGAILRLTRNLVNFQALYDPAKPALFQMGSLVIDGRRLDLTVKVRDRAKHKQVAKASETFLVYASVFGDDGKPAFEVAAPITAGERGGLRVGKRGILLGRDGKEWDAEVVDVVEAPISISEAVRSPFVKLGTFLSERIQALAANTLESAQKTLTSGEVPAGAQAAPAKDAPRSSFQNLAVMLSLATAALGSAAAFLLKVLAETNPLKLMGSLVGIVLLVAFASGFLGWLRLRRRDMSPILEANGWAVNVPLALTRELGELFTRRPPLPGDPRRSRRWQWALLATLVVVLLLMWDEARLRLRQRFLRTPPPAAAATLAPTPPPTS